MSSISNILSRIDNNFELIEGRFQQSEFVKAKMVQIQQDIQLADSELDRELQRLHSYEGLATPRYRARETQVRQQADTLRKLNTLFRQQSVKEATQVTHAANMLRYLSKRWQDQRIEMFFPKEPRQLYGSN
jgi:hypothetical protein